MIFVTEYHPVSKSDSRGDLMSYRDHLDTQSQLFVKNTTRRKHLNSQQNGETKVSLNTIIARGNAKAHRMF